MAKQNDIDLVIRLRNFTDEELRRVGKSVEKTGDTVNKTGRKFKDAGGKITQFGAASTASLAGLTSASLAFNTALLNVIKSTGKFGVAGSLFATTAIAAARATARYDDTLGKLSLRLGVDVEKLSALQLATERGGTQMNVMARAVRNLTRNLLDARSGRGEAADAFERIGFDAGRAGDAALEAIPAMTQIAELLRDLEGSERTGIAGKIFGQLAGPEILPVLIGLVGGLDEAINKVDLFNLKVTLESAKAAAKFNDTIDDTKSIMFGFVRDIGTVFIDKLTTAAGALNAALLKIRETNLAMAKEAAQNSAVDLDANPLFRTGDSKSIDEVENRVNVGTKESLVQAQMKIIQRSVEEVTVFTTTKLRDQIADVEAALRGLTKGRTQESVLKQLLQLSRDPDILARDALPSFPTDSSVKITAAERKKIGDTRAANSQKIRLGNLKEEVALRGAAAQIGRRLLNPTLEEENRLQARRLEILTKLKEVERQIELSRKIGRSPDSLGLREELNEESELFLQLQNIDKLISLREKQVTLERDLVTAKQASARIDSASFDKEIADRRVVQIEKELALLKQGVTRFDSVTTQFQQNLLATALVEVGPFARELEEIVVKKDEALSPVQKNQLAKFLQQYIEARRRVFELKREAIDTKEELAKVLIAQKEPFNFVANKEVSGRGSSALAARLAAAKEEQRLGNQFDPLRDVLQRITDATEIQAQIVGNTASNMRRSFDDLFFNVVTGRFEDLGDVVKAFGNSAVRSLTDAAARAATAAVFRNLFPGLSGGGPGGNFSGGLAALFGGGGTGGASVPKVDAQGSAVVPETGAGTATPTTAAQKSAAAKAKFGQQLGQTFAVIGGAAGVIGATQNSNATVAGVQGGFSGAIATAAFTASPPIIAAVAISAAAIAAAGSIAGRTNRGPRAERALKIFERMIAEINGFLTTSRVDELSKLGSREEILAEFTRRNDPDVPNRLLKSIIAIPTRAGVLSAIELLDGLTTNEQIKRVRGADLSRILLSEFRHADPEDNPGTFSPGTKVADFESDPFFVSSPGKQALFDLTNLVKVTSAVAPIGVSSNGSRFGFLSVVDRQLTTRFRKCGVLDGNGGKRPTWDANGPGVPHPFAQGRPQFDFPGFGLLEALIDALGGGGKGQKAIRDALKPIADRCEAIDQATKDALQSTPFKFKQDLAGGITRTTELRGLGKGSTSVQRGILAREFSDQETDLSRFGLGTTGRTGINDPRSIRILSELRDFILEEDFIADWIRKVEKVKDGLDIPDVQPRPATVFTL